VAKVTPQYTRQGTKRRSPLLHRSSGYVMPRRSAFRHVSIWRYLMQYGCFGIVGGLARNCEKAQFREFNYMSSKKRNFSHACELSLPGCRVPCDPRPATVD
jgi:hypothetical protein